ncbi:MAG: hypothetical protein JNM49_07405 [Flavobacteriales bacterium]|nr:hypothetical protein [Flavobacteriales bacterium]
MKTRSLADERYRQSERASVLNPARLGLLALFIAFVVAKLPYLNLPFYWDEAWVYGKAVRAMAENGLSLLPSAVPPELSRGHPLLFHFLAAGWMKLFGGGFVAMHLFAMTASIALCLATYSLGSLIGSEWTGLAATSVLMVNEIFLAQSGLLLPEVLLALFCTLAIIGTLVRNKSLFLLAMSAALLTKESAIACLFAIMAWLVIRLFETANSAERRQVALWLCISFAPLACAGSFYVIQRIQLGWFLYPEHMSMLTWSASDIAYKARQIYHAAFENQGFVWLTYAIGLASPVLARKAPILSRFAMALANITAVKVLFERWTLPDGLDLAVVSACLAIFYFLLSHQLRTSSPRLNDAVTISFVACVAFWAFTSLNFYTDRYLLALLPFIAVGAVGILNWVGRIWSKRIADWLVIPFVAFALINIGSDNTVGDCRLAYRSGIAVHQEMAAYLESHRYYDEPIHGSFVDQYYLGDPDAGYLSGARVFTRVNTQPLAESRIALADYTGKKDLRAELMKTGFRPLRRFEHGPAWGEILVR